MRYDTFIRSAVIAAGLVAAGTAQHAHAQAPIYELTLNGEITTVAGPGDPGATSQFDIGTPFEVTLVVTEQSAVTGGDSFFDSVISSQFELGSEVFSSTSDDGDFGQIEIDQTPPGFDTFFGGQNLGETDSLRGTLSFNTPGNSFRSWNSDLDRPVEVNGTDFSLSRFSFLLFEENSSGLVTSFDFSEAVENAALFDQLKWVNFQFNNPDGNSSVIYRSVDAVDVSVRVIPAPASCVLFASGALFTVRRRR